MGPGLSPLTARSLTWLGLLAVVAATIWAFAGGAAAPTGTLAWVGLVVVGADAWVAVAESRTADDLALPPGARPAPPPWWLPVGSAGVLTAVTGWEAGAPVVVVAGAVAVAAAIGGAVAARRRGRSSVDLRSLRAARRVRRFVRAHGAEHAEPVTGYLTGLGERWTRLVVAAPDGTWGDAVVRLEAGEQVATLARVKLVEPDDREMGSTLRTGPRSWAVMTSKF